MSHAMQAHPRHRGHKSSDKTWSAGGGNGKPLQYSCHKNPMDSIKRQKDMTQKKSPTGQTVSSVLLEKSGGQILSAPERMKWLGQWRWCSVVDVSGGEGKIQCYKEQYSIGIWNVKSMNQGKLDMVMQEMARVNINILGISELKWTKMG